MTPVTEVLVRLGRPPAEICLDWAWQLQQLELQSRDSPRAAFATELTINNFDPLAAWSNFAVDSQGILHPYRYRVWPIDAGDDGSFQPLIAQLNRWAEISLEGAADGDCQNTLRTAAPTERQLRPACGHRHVYLAAGMFIATGIVMLGALRWHTNQPSPHPSAETGAGPTELLGPEVTFLQSEAGSQTSPPLVDSVDSMTIETLRPEWPQAELPIISTVNEPAPGGGNDRPPELTFTAPGMEGHVATTTSDIRMPADRSQLGPTGEAPIDVLGELANLAKTATAQIGQQMVDRDLDPATAQPALVLNITPPNQLQAFDKSLRPRQALWHLRLAVSEGFTVLPSQAQRVAGRNRTSWVIQVEPTEKSKRDDPVGYKSTSSTKTEVMVQAVLAHQHQTALRWQIAAVASDFPGLAIPLDRDWLTQVQTMLRTLTQRLLAEVERTRLMGRADGLPSAVRSELSAHRRSLESQHKLATRWLEIVADAHQFHGWLDGQIEVHAKLLDSAQAPWPTMLQFGNP